MRNVLLAATAALVAVPVLSAPVGAQGVSVQLGRPDPVVRERTTVVRQAPVESRRRTVVVEEEEDECRITKRKVRVNGRMVTRTIRENCD